MGSLFGDKNDLNQVFDLLDENECMNVDLNAEGEHVNMRVCKVDERTLKFDSDSMDVSGTLTIEKRDNGEIEIDG